MVDSHKYSVIGTMEHNNSINFGDTLMSTSMICLAQAVSAEYDGGKGKTITELSVMFDRKRPQIGHLIYLADVMPQSLHWYFLNGYVGLKPLVELHKKYKDVLQPTLDAIIDNKEEGKTKRITAKDVESHLGVMHPTVAKLQTLTSIPQAVPCSNPKDGITSVHKIRAILNEACSMNQDEFGKATIDASDIRKICSQLNLLEQFFDDVCESPTQQGDPTDQSLGSYVHDNMVDDLETDYMGDFYSYEDLSQDPQDYRN